MNEVINVLSIISLIVPLFHLMIVTPIVIIYDEKTKPVKIRNFFFYNLTFFLISLCNIIILMK